MIGDSKDPAMDIEDKEEEDDYECEIDNICFPGESRMNDNAGASSQAQAEPNNNNS